MADIQLKHFGAFLYLSLIGVYLFLQLFAFGITE